MKKLQIRKKGRGHLARLGAVFAAAAVFACAAPMASPYVGAVDVYQFNENGFYYTISAVSGTIEASIVGYDAASGKGAGITVPPTLGGYPVTSIGPDAFAGQTTITSVSIPSNIKIIGAGAFQNCTAMTSATVAAGVTEISENTFKGCTALNSVTIPASVRKIGKSAFENCSSLKTLTLAEGLTSIGSYAFRKCSSITALAMPNSLEEVGEGAFEECIGITTIKFSPALTNIADFTFYKCSGLTAITLTENIISIGRYAFAECPLITSLSFPRSVLTLGASAFENCRSLAVVIIPHTMQNISSTAFRNDPVALYGYTGTYAEEFAHRNNIPFTSYGSVYNVTFSANIPYVTVDNISIKSKNGNVVPPAVVLNDEDLDITATAPEGYEIDRITINGEAFTNGSAYRVHNSNVGIIVYYKLKGDDEPITSASETRPPVTSSDATSATSATTKTTSKTTAGTTAAPETTPSTDNTTTPPDDGNNADSYVKVKSDLNDINGVNVRIVTQKENFIGPATVRLTNTDSAKEKCEKAAEDIGIENAKIYSFDINLLDINGNVNNGILAKGTITFMIPVPNELLPYINDISVYHIEDGKAELLNSSIIEDINGVKRVQFETGSFSPYMFVADTDNPVKVIVDPDETNAAPVTQPGNNSGNSGNNGGEAVIVDNGKTKPSNNGSRNPYTGQIIALGVPSAALISALLVKSRKNRRKRTKSEVE